MTVPLSEARDGGTSGAVILHRFRALMGDGAPRAVSARQELSYLGDLKAAIEAAVSHDDFMDARRLLYLHCDYIPNLASVGAARLIEYLEDRGVWREFADWPVYKTAGVPCIAFTAQVRPDGKAVDLIVLGTCYRYPTGTDEGWWCDAILPRVREL